MGLGGAGGGVHHFKMLLPESSTNTGNEVFTGPRGLNKLAVGREEKERQESKKKVCV